ncbi:polyprenyl synthetase family protein [Lysobacter sp. N42]|uniref:polyprenyl synthetase family protein n=1 Tax=Lysobacter sp. N42 TaxID=2545719 RepID=UPI0010448BA7|nr:farnesyl diphosphate synthase [Lysobacter sp. N42]TCZ89022.1 polyprenyl synthetase family protein [Lysobacter sp. N42]
MPEARLAGWRTRIDAALAQALDSADVPAPLDAAMRHAVLLGGKRMRPLLTLATASMFADEQPAVPAAVAVELVHAYSLVHDDLPAMDDDALRRGQPTVHVAFDEATAVLAGDALQALAFDVLAAADLAPERIVALVATLARAAGGAGMCGGQALDLAATGRSAATSLAGLERLHALKTGALIRACVRMGALSVGADGSALDALDRYATALGLAFQVRDDLLDVEGDSAQLGKTAGKDAAQDKATFPALLGLDASRERLAALRVDMDAALERFGSRADALRELARLAVERTA